MKKTLLFGSIAAALYVKRLLIKERPVDLDRKVVLITGGTTGLGFELMRQLLQQGCRLAICARDAADLQTLKENYPEVLAVRCDVAKRDEVGAFVDQTIRHFGQLDVVINNAGIIMVAPMEGFTEADYHHAMDVMYWGIVHTTFAALPYFKARGEGQIVNITSVGGKVSIPHLLPYSAAKFAAVGFSEGIAHELRQHGISVTTVVPGLMRTGSYVNALFQEDQKSTFKLFAAISSAPFLTIDTEKAARKTIAALRLKRATKVLGVPAKLLIGLHHFFPESTSRLLGVTAKLLPGEDTPNDLVKGKQIDQSSESAQVPVLRAFGELAQEKFQEQRRV